MMKVVLYTSSCPGKINQLNIAHLINSCPDFEYTYVVVDNRIRYIKNTLKVYVKEIILRILFKRPDWYSARRNVERKVAKIIPDISKKNINKIVVKEVNDQKTEKIIKSLNPDLIIQCGAGILKENIYSIPRLGTLNVHHGIAPELRGVSSTFWAMYYGMHNYIGVTVHFIDKTLDTGIVILQKTTSLPFFFDYVEAVFQTSKQGAPLLTKAINMIQNDYEIIETEVKSFYFSSENWKKYRELKNNSFNPVMSNEKLTFKLKKKYFYEKKYHE